VNTLRQRGIRRGAVLVLADGSGPLCNLERVAELQFTRGSIESAANLVSHELSACVVTMACVAERLEEVLKVVAARLRPEAPLVLILPRAQKDPREAVHLLLLRSGYDHVWVDSRDEVICASARRAAAAGARTCSIIIPVFNEKATFPALMQAVLGKRLDHLGLER